MTDARRQGTPWLLVREEVSLVISVLAPLPNVLPSFNLFVVYLRFDIFKFIETLYMIVHCKSTLIFLFFYRLLFSPATCGTVFYTLESGSSYVCHGGKENVGSLGS